MSVTHASLTGNNLHEPKGVENATAGQVYVADGSASGAWSAPFTVDANLKNKNLVALNVRIDDISTASSVWIVSPIAGKVTKVYSVINGPITVADTTLTVKIGGVSVTGGSITIAFTGSAAGDVDSCSPIALNTVTAGQAIEIDTDGASTDTASAQITILLDVS